MGKEFEQNTLRPRFFIFYFYGTFLGPVWDRTFKVVRK